MESLPAHLAQVQIAVGRGTGSQIGIDKAFAEEEEAMILVVGATGILGGLITQRLLGDGKEVRILVRHLLPNAILPVLVIASMNIGSYVLNFAALSFLGLGAQRGYADWGQMINFARNWIPSLSEHWYIVLFPGAAIVLFVLAWNLVGDALRDILDPRMRGTRGAV